MDYQDIISKLNQIVSETGLFPKEPNYRYWQTKGLRINYMCGYTTEKVDGKFSAFIYKENKKANTWKLIKQVKFSRRWKACERAYRWYCQKMGKEVPEKPVFHTEEMVERRRQIYKERFLKDKKPKEELDKGL